MEDPSAQYQVPGEPGVYWCARHRKVQTRLRCGRCEKPICPKCTKFGPTGARCPDCASNRTAHIYQINPLQYVTGGIVAMALGAIAGFIVRIDGIGLLTLFYAPVAGTLIGKAVSYATKGKRGTPLALIASAAVVLGALIPTEALLPALLAMATQGPAFDPQLQLGQPLGHVFMTPFVWVYLFLAIPGIWWWLR